MNRTEHLALHAINSTRDLYSEEVHEVLERLDEPVSKNKLYYALRMLERRGLISWSWGRATKTQGGRRKKLYRITGLGLHELSSQFRKMRAICG